MVAAIRHAAEVHPVAEAVSYGGLMAIALPQRAHPAGRMMLIAPAVATIQAAVDIQAAVARVLCVAIKLLTCINLIQNPKQRRMGVAAVVVAKAAVAAVVVAKAAGAAVVVAKAAGAAVVAHTQHGQMMGIQVMMVTHGQIMDIQVMMVTHGQMMGILMITL
jgi:hypothetical protein